MKRTKFVFLVITIVAFFLLVGSGTVAASNNFKWVIVSSASALANDNSKITVTGTGTFAQGEPEDVTGGGTWTTFDPTGAVTASGTYEVTRLVRFDQAPGAVADPTIKAGLAFLGIKYSDGSHGVLVVSCHLPGTPSSVFEGITASKGYVGYWERDPAVAGVNANRTNFHELH